MAASIRPRLYPWGPRTLYVGLSQNLSPHRSAVACMAIGLEADFLVSHDPRAHSPTYRICRSALLRPNTLHHLRDASGLMAFLYLDPFSSDLDHVGRLMNVREQLVGFDLNNQTVVVEVLLRLWRTHISWQEARNLLQHLLLGAAREPDPRIKVAIQKIVSDPACRLSAAQLARAAGLSESRFLHLFTEETGVPLRRYRLWCAMGAALRSIAEGSSLTSAALDTGFASSAHFSTAFRDMFGMKPSQLTRGGVQVQQRCDHGSTQEPPRAD